MTITLTQGTVTQILISHFRKRINQAFKDGDRILVTLKDRKRPQTEEERDWYEKAFGEKRNIMKYSIVYKPFNAKAKKNEFEIFAKIQYQMFPEMQEEFPYIEPH